MKKYLSATIFLLALLNLIDMGITAYLLTHSHMVVETNIFMHTLWNVSPLLFIAYKATLSVCFILIAVFLKRAHKWMYIVMMPITAAYFGIVGWSVYVLVNVI